MFSSKLVPILKRKSRFNWNLISRNFCIPRPLEPVVTILNATTKIGRQLALLLKQNPSIGELRLYDKSKDVSGIAEDLSHIDTKSLVKSYGGLNVLKHAVQKADIVVTLGGSKQSLDETPKILFEKNVDDVRLATMHMIEFNPKGIFCIARPPVEALVPLVSEEYIKAGVYDPRKILGITTPGSMRVNSIIANWADANALDVLCPIVGGLSGECLVGVFSQTRPRGLLLQPSEVQKRIVSAEDDVLKLYEKAEPLSLAPALGISRFVNTLLRALKGDMNCVDCSFVRQTGHIGNFLPYMTSIVRLSRHGVLSTHMPKCSNEEGQLLKTASICIKQFIELGEKCVTGEAKTIKEIKLASSK